MPRARVAGHHEAVPLPEARETLPFDLQLTHATPGMSASSPSVSPPSSFWVSADTSLRDVQDSAGHADPRTTRRYDRGRHSLDRFAGYHVAAYVAS